jgi:hypothetical protein
VDILNHPAFSASILLSVSLEYAVSRKRGLKNYDGWESFSNLALIGADRVLTRITHTDSPFLAEWLFRHRLWDLPLKGAWGLVATFFATELAYYWAHRYNHGANLGWATHQMHHAPTKYNLTLGYRLGVTKFFSLAWMIFLPLMLLGFEPKSIALVAGAIFLVQFFLHTEFIPRLGILDGVLNTPSNHRVHHSSDPALYGKNLGGLTVIFDRMFGTYVPEPLGGLDYGIPAIMAPRSLLHEVFHQWSVVLRAAFRAPFPMGSLRVLFGSPALLAGKTEHLPNLGKGQIPKRVPVLAEAEFGFPTDHPAPGDPVHVTDPFSLFMEWESERRAADQDHGEGRGQLSEQKPLYP